MYNVLTALWVIPVSIATVCQLPQCLFFPAAQLTVEVIANFSIRGLWIAKRHYIRQTLAGFDSTHCMIHVRQQLKLERTVNEYGDVCLTINVCVSLRGTFSLLINVPNSSVNTEALCGLIITRNRIICQDDWFWTCACIGGYIWYLHAVNPNVFL